MQPAFLNIFKIRSWNFFKNLYSTSKGVPTQTRFKGKSLVGDIGLPSFWTPALWVPEFFLFAYTSCFCYNGNISWVVLMVRWPSGKARVCKTLIRGFDSHPHLIFLPKKAYFVVALSVGYLRANARVSPVFLPRSRLELSLFSLKKSRNRAASAARQ